MRSDKIRNHTTDLDKLLKRYVTRKVNEVECVRIETWLKSISELDRYRDLTEYEEQDIFAKLKVSWN